MNWYTSQKFLPAAFWFYRKQVIYLVCGKFGRLSKFSNLQKKRGKKKDIRYKEKIIKNEQEEKLNHVAKETAAVTKLNFFTFLNTF